MNIIRLYNQNRKQLFILILIVAFIISTIHFVNYLVKKDNQENLNNNEESSSSTSSTATTYNPQKSSISSSSVSDKVYKNQSELIDRFMKYCNAGKKVEAYNLLSNDCKEVMFPTLEYFVNNYYKEIFTENRLYSIKNWTSSTYKISITENILATGKSNNGVALQDYFTIIKENGEEKLNINSFIGRRELSQKGSSSNIELEVIYIDTYMDYAIYTLKATNKTDKTILLDSGESTQRMYLLDENNVKYTSYRNEITNAQLKVLPYAKNTFKVKYASGYVSTIQINSIIFSDIILDFGQYDMNSLKESYTNRGRIKIEL